MDAADVVSGAMPFFGSKGRVDVAERVYVLRILVYTVPVGFLMGVYAGGILGGIIGSAGFSGLGIGVYYFVISGTARAVGSLVLPDRRGDAGVGYSHIEAIEAKGDFALALREWEAVIAASPNAVAARVHAADLHAHHGNNPVRAAELFRELQTHANAPDETQRYASQRLIDLLLGPLHDEGRALVELRKVADNWPNTPEGDGARKAIARIKASSQ